MRQHTQLHAGLVCGYCYRNAVVVLDGVWLSRDRCQLSCPFCATTEKAKPSCPACYQLRNNRAIAPENVTGTSSYTRWSKHMEEARYLEIAKRKRGTPERDWHNTTCPHKRATPKQAFLPFGVSRWFHSHSCMNLGTVRSPRGQVFSRLALQDHSTGMLAHCGGLQYLHYSSSSCLRLLARSCESPDPRALGSA